LDVREWAVQLIAIIGFGGKIVFVIWVDFVANMNLVCEPVTVEYTFTYRKRMGVINKPIEHQSLFIMQVSYRTQ
jgi:hypothetical protein